MSSFLVYETFTATFDVMLSGKPTLDELFEHVDIYDEWYQIGVLLKLDTAELDSISLNNVRSRMRTLKMFDLWLSTNPKATRKEIIDTLKKPVIYKIDVANKYLMALKESEFEK